MKRSVLILLLFITVASCKCQDYIAWVQPETEQPCTEGYGLLYNWYAATDVKKITSSDDWVVSSRSDLTTLQTTLGGFSVTGGKLKEIGLTYWNTPNTGADNTSGFNGRGAGYRSNSGTFFSLTNNLYITNYDYDSFFSSVLYNTAQFNLAVNSGPGTPKYGKSIRLVYVGAGTPTSYTGNDGKTYRVVQIGTQYWIADNLQETKFRNGDVINYHGNDNDTAYTNAEWAALTTAGVCAYNNDVANVGCSFTFPEETITAVKYGYLYNWYVVDDARNLSNTGWHVPISTDYFTLTSYLGGSSVSGGKLKDTLYTYWNSPNTDATNETGFNGRGAGRRSSIDGTFGNILANNIIWFDWTSGANVVYATMSYNAASFGSGSGASRSPGYSIRLIKDSTTLSDGQTGTYIGNDGKVYRTICIGTQEWLADNLAETKYRNGDWITGYNGGVYTTISDAAWVALTTEAMCVYNDDENNK